jgi:hypothetical protein
MRYSARVNYSMSAHRSTWRLYGMSAGPDINLQSKTKNMQGLIRAGAFFLKSPL